MYPDCVLNQLLYQPGDAASVSAEDLLPNTEAHVFLGITEVGTGITDDEGNITIDFNIPQDAALGERLITVGTLAVTADCFLTLVPEPNSGILILFAGVAFLFFPGRLFRKLRF